MIITYNGTSFEVDAVLGNAWLALRSYERDLAAHRRLDKIIEATAREIVAVWQRDRRLIPDDRFDMLLRLAVHDAVRGHVFTRLCVRMRLLEVSELAADTDLCAQIALGLGTLARRLETESQEDDPERVAMRTWLLEFVGMWRGHPVFDRVCQIAGWPGYSRDDAREYPRARPRALTDGHTDRRERRRPGSHRIERRRRALCLPRESGA